MTPPARRDEDAGEAAERLAHLRADIEAGSYLVDAEAVAEALLRRLFSPDGARDPARRPPPDPRR